MLLDAQIIRDAAKNKMNLGSLLEITLHSKSIKPMITQCSIRHLYDHSPTTATEKREKDSCIEVAKAAERRKCGHHELEKPLSTLECLESCVDPKGSGKNKHRYVVASQDDEVRKKMRTIAGVPLIYITHGMMILEPMSNASVETKEREERGKVRIGLKGRRSASDAGIKRKRVHSDEEEDTEAADARSEIAIKKRKVKGPKGPNPLSAKKPKDKIKTWPSKQIEDERAVLRKAAKADPQAAEKALGASIATANSTAEGVTDGPRKRKRKRKTDWSTGLDGVTGVGAMTTET